MLAHFYKYCSIYSCASKWHTLEKQIHIYSVTFLCEVCEYLYLLFILMQSMLILKCCDKFYECDDIMLNETVYRSLSRNVYRFLFDNSKHLCGILSVLIVIRITVICVPYSVQYIAHTHLYGYRYA